MRADLYSKNSLLLLFLNEFSNEKKENINRKRTRLDSLSFTFNEYFFILSPSRSLRRVCCARDFGVFCESS